MSLQSDMQTDNYKSKRGDDVKKPRVLGIVILLFLRAFLVGFLTLANINQINAVLDNSDYIVESWALPLNYALFAFAVASFVAAVLIVAYKRNGLIIGGALIVIDLVAMLGLMLLAGETPSVLGVVLNFAVLYYINKYMSPPESEFFT